MADSVVHTPFPTGSPWLVRALVLSAVLHALGVLGLHVALSPGDSRTPEEIDVEIAPPPPPVEALPAERATPVLKPSGEAEKVAASTAEPPKPAEPPEPALIDAGVDAEPDAAVADAAVPDAAVPDAAVPEVAVSVSDAATASVSASDAASVAVAATETGTGSAGGTGSVAGTGSGSGSGSGSGLGLEMPGMPAAIVAGMGSGAPGMTDEPAVSGAPTSAGTAANLLAYFPPGHVVGALVRFDRLRGTEWAAPIERLLQPLPDYRGLFGTRDAHLTDRLDTLVFSTPRPRDATATTLVVHTHLSRGAVRDFLAGADNAITWSVARGGMLGRRTNRTFPDDHRLVLSPWQGWFVLASPLDLGALTVHAKGSLDRIEATGTLPPWLATIRTIEQESGDDATGPALIVTLAGDGQRVQLPDIGLGVTSLPTPQRVSVAVELVPHGWWVRGNMTFANEADAAELVRAVQGAQQRIADSRVLSLVLRQQHVLDAITGLSLARSGARVSYATRASIADARVVLAAAAAMLDQYFAQPGRGGPDH